MNLLVMVEKTEVVFPEHEGCTCCGWREPENTTHFPPFLLCNYLHAIAIKVGYTSLHFNDMGILRKIEGTDIVLKKKKVNLLITTPLGSLYIENMQI